MGVVAPTAAHATSCELNCPATGTYQVNNTSMTLAGDTLSGAGNFASNTVIGAFNFVFTPPNPIHPPNPCTPLSLLPVNFAGPMNVLWGDGEASVINWTRVILPPSPLLGIIPLIPPNPIKGVGTVTSGPLTGKATTLNWTPPSPLCPISNKTFTGTIAIS